MTVKRKPVRDDDGFLQTMSMVVGGTIAVLIALGVIGAAGIVIIWGLAKVMEWALGGL